MRVSVAVFSALLVAGCFGSPRADPDGGAGSLAACPFVGGHGYDPSIAYPFCQWDTPDGFMKYCPKTFNGWNYLNWHTTDDGTGSLCHDDASCDTCLCGLGCDDTPTADGGVAVPCPQPETGTAGTECLAEGGHMQCLVMCEHGETCPDGMRCVETAAGDELAGHQVCAWAVGDDRCSL
jgi:hypothetical protein